MRRLLALLLLASCDGQDALGQLTARIDDVPADASTCVLSGSASSHRPNGLYVLAELPSGQLEMDIDEGGAPDPKRVIWRELDASGHETFHSQSVQGGVTLLGPPRERRGEFDLTFQQAD